MPRTTTPGRKPREQRRRELLDAARDVFIASGYHAASMDEIADHAGVSKPVLYQYFAGKLYLYLAVLDAACERLITGIDEGTALAESPHDRVQAIMHAYFAFVTDPIGDFHLIFSGDMGNEPAVRLRVQRLDDDLTNRISLMLSHGSTLSAADTALVAAGLLGLAQRSASQWLSSRQPGEPVERATDLVTRLAWHGIVAVPGAGPTPPAS